MRTPASIFKHPIHPMLIVFPIGLWIFSLACDLIRLAGASGDAWSTVAFFSMIGGFIGALCAAVPGFIDLLFYKGGAPPVKKIALTHMAINLTARTQFAAADGLRRGAYILADAPNGRPDIILIATGSEVGLIMAARLKLQDQHVKARVVSMPSWELFDAQPQSYRDQVILPSVRARLAVEAGASQGWHRYVGDGGDVLGVERFGASAPGDVVMREYGFTAENVCKRALAVLG